MPLLLLPNCQRTKTGHILPACLFGACPRRLGAGKPAPENRPGTTDVSQIGDPPNEIDPLKGNRKSITALVLCQGVYEKIFCPGPDPSVSSCWGAL